MSDDNEYRIDVSMGSLEVDVRGSDKDWVAEQFELIWSERLSEANEMKEAIRRMDVSTQ